MIILWQETRNSQDRLRIGGAFFFFRFLNSKLCLLHIRIGRQITRCCLDHICWYASGSPGEEELKLARLKMEPNSRNQEQGLSGARVNTT